MGDGFRDRLVIVEDLVMSGGVVIGRGDHQAIGAEFLGFLGVAHGIGRVGVHGADHHLHAAGDMLDGGFDITAALFIGDRQKFTGGAEDDDAGDAAGELPIEKTLECGFVDALAVGRERSDGDAVTAAKLLGHRNIRIDRLTRGRAAGPHPRSGSFGETGFTGRRVHPANICYYSERLGVSKAVRPAMRR